MKKLAQKKDKHNFFLHLWPNFRTLKIIISGKIWTYIWWTKRQQSLEKQHLPVHTAHCNFKHFKFAMKNSQRLLYKTLFCYANSLKKCFLMKSFSKHPHSKSCWNRKWNRKFNRVVTVSVGYPDIRHSLSCLAGKKMLTINTLLKKIKGTFWYHDLYWTLSLKEVPGLCQTHCK